MLDPEMGRAQVITCSVLQDPADLHTLADLAAWARNVPGTPAYSQDHRCGGFQMYIWIFMYSVYACSVVEVLNNEGGSSDRELRDTCTILSTNDAWNFMYTIYMYAYLKRLICIMEFRTTEPASSRFQDNYAVSA